MHFHVFGCVQKTISIITANNFLHPRICIQPFPLRRISNLVRMVSESQMSSIRMNEFRAFDETKAGVKGLVDGGITKLPPMFIHSPEGLGCVGSATSGGLSVPTIDLDGVGKDPVRHRQAMDEIRDASESWGFFRIINHGIPVSVLHEVIDGTRKFHEQDVEAKAQFYTRENRKGLSYCSNYHMYTLPDAEWRDMIFCSMAPVAPEPEDLPAVCGEILMEYSKRAMELGRMLFKLLSEGLGLEPNHLLDMGCDEGLTMLGHYYPPCPEPELTLGIRKHSDNNFMAIVAQDNLGGLQVLHQDQWVEVEPIPGALVVNIGNILQMVSNDKYKSVEHRVVAKSVGPRISVASFFTTGRNISSKVFGPIKELLSEENPAKYPAMTVMEYDKCYKANKADGSSTLMHLKI